MSSCSTLLQLLQTLVESAQGSWTYIIFWDLATVNYYESWLGWGDGYFCFTGQCDGRKSKTLSTLGSISDQEYRKKTLRYLNSLLPDEDRLSENSSSLEHEVTDEEWFFVNSLTQSFVTDGNGLPCQAWRNSVPIWLTGADVLGSCHCIRVSDALRHGFQTLVFIPAVNGVVELGSTSQIFQSLNLFNKAVPLLNFIDSREKGRHIQRRKKAESFDSVGNKEISLGLHLGLKSLPVKTEDECKSSSSVGNFPVSVVKEKSVFSGKLQCGGDDNSDSSDLKAFIRILKRRRT